jgi:hypothetical protein
MKNLIQISSWFLLCFCFSCGNEPKDRVTVLPHKTKADTLVHSNDRESISKAITTIDSLETESELLGWTDDGSFFLLNFEPGKVYYGFNPSCEYWFPSRIIDNEIIFYWAINEDCTFERGMKKTFKNIRNPILGEPFGKIKMVNDSVLEVDYYYTDWVKRVNEEEKKSIDTLFPKRFRPFRS